LILAALVAFAPRSSAQFKSEAFSNGFGGDDVAPADSAEAEYLTRWEQNSRLMRLADLDPQERLLLLGQTVGGKSTRELAQELGLTPGQVRVRLHRIRRRLRKGEEGEP
jgi:RNA polymerase sigma factor (sigma-70 family)